MSRKQLAALFLCSIVPWTVGNGLVPLLPVYAASLGAAPAVSGLYLAFCYLALALLCDKKPGFLASKTRFLLLLRETVFLVLGNPVSLVS